MPVKFANAKHGSPWTYKDGCRCRSGERAEVGCTEAWAAYRRLKEHGPDGRRARARAARKAEGGA
jgi:hypothetical protein